jgi:hypothetical protein
MPLERHIDDLTACDGIKFRMSDGERPVSLQSEPRGAARPCRPCSLPGTDERPIASLLNRSRAMLTTRVQALMTLASFSSLRRRSLEWAAAHEEELNGAV